LQISISAWRKGVKKHCPLQKDLAKTQVNGDAEAVALALTGLEESNPFDHRDKQLLVSFSTRYTSTANDEVNAERAAEVGREMQDEQALQTLSLLYL